MLNILYLYNETQTYTNTVYDHISCFRKYSKHRPFFCHQSEYTNFNLDLSRFDAIAIHYSIRLPFDQISSSAEKALSEFKGLKFLFIQDEYDHTHRAWHWIKALGIQLVFTVVPPNGVEKVYPPSEFPHTRFVSILTGYVPHEFSLPQDLLPPSQRLVTVGYRGNSLPIRYGQLGIEKIQIGSLVKRYCDDHNIKHDISWSAKDRIYGENWYKFIVSCRSMLGCESGSNVFDWDGTLVQRIHQFRKENPTAKDSEIYEKYVKSSEINGIMNQISPRAFECIAAKTVLVLFEGHYSGILKAKQHFIPLKKDGSNIADVIRLLQDDIYVDEMAERAWYDVIVSGHYSYQSFVSLVEKEILASLDTLGTCKNHSFVMDSNAESASPVTTWPIRAVLTLTGEGISHGPLSRIKHLAIRYLWGNLPESFRLAVKPALKWIYKFKEKAE